MGGQRHDRLQLLTKKGLISTGSGRSACAERPVPSVAAFQHRARLSANHRASVTCPHDRHRTWIAVAGPTPEPNLTSDAPLTRAASGHSGGQRGCQS
jgi:hypothetical protein